MTAGKKGDELRLTVLWAVVHRGMQTSVLPERPVILSLKAVGPCCLACLQLKASCLVLAPSQPASPLRTVLSSLFALLRAEASLVSPSSFRITQYYRKPNARRGLQMWPQSVV